MENYIQKNRLTGPLVRSFTKFAVKKGIHLFKLREILYYCLLPFNRTRIECDYKKSYKYLDSLHKYSNGKCYGENKVKKSKYDLKIIVPAYNVKKYLGKCMESILSQQTGYRFKIILVDDGSTDGTEAIVDHYGTNPKVEIVHQSPRGGVSKARNAALSILDSDYICFVDSDDIMAPGFIETFMKAIIDNNADIVEGSCFNLIGDYVTFHHGYLIKHKTKSHNALTGFPWGKIFRSSLFINCIFPENFWYEDTCLRLNLFQRTDRILLLPNTAYFYRNNPNGYTAASSKRTSRNLDTVWVTKSLFDSREKLGVPLTASYIEDLLNQFVVNYVRTSFFDNIAKEAIFQMAVSMIDDIYSSEFKVKRHRALLNALRNKDYGAYELYMKTHRGMGYVWKKKSFINCSQ